MGGQKVGSYPDLNSAQQAYNNSYYGAGGPGAAAAPAAAGAGSLQGLLDAIASGDTARMQEAIREFNQDYLLKQQQATQAGREFDINTALKQQQDYTGLASDLLKTAASLRGPQDYFQYNKYLSGGKDLFSQLYGNQPVAAFGQPTGALQPADIGSLMGSLGFRTAPQLPTSFWDPIKQNWFTEPTPPSGSINNPAPMSTQSPQSPPVMDTGGKVTGPPGGHILAILQVGEKVIPATGKNANQTITLRHNGYTKEGIPIFDQGGIVQAPPVTGPIARGQYPAGTTASNWAYTPGVPQLQNQTSPTGTGGELTTPTAPPAGTNLGPGGSTNVGMEPSQNPWVGMWNGFWGPNSGTGFGGPETNPTPPPPTQAALDVANYQAGGTNPNPQTAPSPYQINPAVYDSMSPTGKALLQSLVAAQGWDWNDYLAQINAQRPTGTASPISVYSYYTPGSARASTEGMAGVY